MKEELKKESQPSCVGDVIRRFVVHHYADDEGDVSECGRGYFADVSFENGTSDKSKVTCKQCLKALSKNAI